MGGKVIAALALLFSLIAPGSGHALTGDWTQAIIIGALFALGKNALLPLCLRLFKVQTLRSTLLFFYACNCLQIVLIFYACISAFWYGLQAHEMYFLRACLVAVAIILVQKNTKNKFIFTALCGREGMWELMQKMRKSPTRKK